MDVKRKLYEGIAVTNALYGEECMAVAEKILNGIEMRRLMSMFGVTGMGSVRHEEVGRRSGEAEQCVLR